MLGWHFCRNDKRLGFEDGRQIRTGRTLKVKPPVILCKHGLHASKRIIDALKYSQGHIICKVKLSGKIIHDTDKSVATERTVIAMVNGERLLHEFACDIAEKALKRANVTDKRSWNAIKVKRLWLDGKATDEELSAAYSAAYSAARYAAGYAARYAARSAAWRTQNQILTRRVNKLIKENQK